MTHDEYIQAGKAATTRAIDLPNPPTILQIQEAYGLINDIKREYFREDRVCGKPCNKCCIESFGVNQGEVKYILHGLNKNTSNNKITQIKRKAANNIQRMLQIGKVISPDSKTIPTGAILKAIEQRQIIMRCPMLKDAALYETIEIKQHTDRAAEKAAKHKNLPYSPKYKDEEKKFPDDPTCLLGEYKPISCIVYGVANELSYVRNDVGEKLVMGVCPDNLKINDEKGEDISHRFIPLFYLLKEHGGGHLSVIKYVLKSGLTILSAVINEKKLRQKGIIQ